jgi:hypothetical protein
MNEIKGIALTRPRFKNRDRVYMGGIELYEGQLLDVLDHNDDGDILALSPKDNAGIGDILGEDILCFLPIRKENGVIIPVELHGVERMNWHTAAHIKGTEKFNILFIAKCIATQKVTTNLSDFL